MVNLFSGCFIKRGLRDLLDLFHATLVYGGSVGEVLSFRLFPCIFSSRAALRVRLRFSAVWIRILL